MTSPRHCPPPPPTSEDGGDPTLRLRTLGLLDGDESELERWPPPPMQGLLPSPLDQGKVTAERQNDRRRPRTPIPPLLSPKSYHALPSPHTTPNFAQPQSSPLLTICTHGTCSGPEYEDPDDLRARLLSLGMVELPSPSSPRLSTKPCHLRGVKRVTDDEDPCDLAARLHSIGLVEMEDTRSLCSAHSDLSRSSSLSTLSGASFTTISFYGDTDLSGSDSG